MGKPYKLGSQGAGTGDRLPRPMPGGDPPDAQIEMEDIEFAEQREAPKPTPFVAPAPVAKPFRLK